MSVFNCLQMSSSETSPDTPKRRYKHRVPERDPSGQFRKISGVVDEIVECVKRNKLWHCPKNLDSSLHGPGVTLKNALIQDILISQYSLAKKLGRNSFEGKLRRQAALHQNDDWLIKNLGYKPRKTKPVDLNA